ncbi:ABC transporter ATP-binding protein [Limnobacter sp.]|uniref:ABC transporter ATP-binding protein n=1 Tax=Limnobacter sp. TaxID=2003368 RepID=UPI0035137766
MLDIQGLTVHYGGVQAVKGIGLQVRERELVCLIGCNGAGKTTTLKAIAGLQPFQATQALLDGQHDLSRMPAHARLKHGLALVPEGRGVFTRMSIEENLDLGAGIRTDKADIENDKEHWYTMFPRLKERRKQLAGTLSGGEQQMLAIARALMGRPRCLLLDEPSMGLAPIMVEKIFDVVRTIHQQGMTVLLVEQNAHIALQIADRAYVMDSGLIDIEGQAADLIHDPRIRQAYLGEQSTSV